MTVRIGDWEFDSHAYDAEADVLYLSIGEPRDGYGEESPRGTFCASTTTTSSAG